MQIQKAKPGYKLVKSLFGKYEEIPEDWKMSKLYEIAKLQGGFAFKSEDYVESGIRLLKIANVSHGKIIWDEKSFVPKKFWGKLPDFQIPSGTIIIAMTRPIISGGLKIAIFYGEEKTLLNQRVGKFNIKNIDKNFFYNFLNQKYIINQITNRQSETGQPNISSDEIEKIPIWYPLSMQEQQKIAAILSNVDNLIDSYGKAIESTSRLKTGLMQQLFTKGIGHKKFKKVKWYFGKTISIPEKWSMKRLEKVITKTQLGVNNVGIVNGEGIPLLKMGNLTFGSFNFDKLERIQPNVVENTSSYLLKKGDFLFNTRNSDILVGKCSVWKGDLENTIFNNNLMRIWFNPDEIINSDFVSYFLNSPIGRISIRRLVDRTTSVAAIYFKQLKTFRMILPPLKEQKQIVSILLDTDSRIEGLEIKKTNLENLKKGLIQKLLTGQIRV